MSKRKNLQPWLDYFHLLHTYEQTGYLELQPDKHEAYITRAALLTLAGINPEDVQSAAVPQQLTDTARRIRTYAAYLAANQRGQKDYDPKTIPDPAADLPPIPEKELTAYLSQNFALHMVSEDTSHKPLCTLLLSLKRNHIGRKTDHIEVISYVEEDQHDQD